MRQLPCLDLLNTDARVTAFGLTHSLDEGETRDDDLDRLRDYSAGYPILDDTSMRDYYEVTAVNLALMSIVDDDGQGLLSRARRIMHTAMGAWYELGYLTALRAGVQDAAISGFAEELRDLEVAQQCEDVGSLSTEGRRGESDTSIAGIYYRKVTQKLIWFMVEQEYRPPSPWS